MTSPTGQVAVFWDFDSCPASPSSSGYAVVENIRTLALRFGTIKSFKAYLTESDLQSTSTTLRSELQSSGVSLTDVACGRDAAGKMLLVDMLACALDQPPAQIVLMVITADHTHGYGFSILRMRSYQIVLLTPERNKTPGLTSQATVSYNWGYDEAVKDDPPPHMSAHPDMRKKACNSDRNSGGAAPGCVGQFTQQESTVAPPRGATQFTQVPPWCAMHPTEANFSDDRFQAASVQQNSDNLQRPPTPIVEVPGEDECGHDVLGGDEEEDAPVVGALAKGQPRQEDADGGHNLARSASGAHTLPRGGAVKALDDTIVVSAYESTAVLDLAPRDWQRPTQSPPPSPSPVPPWHDTPKQGEGLHSSHIDYPSDLSISPHSTFSFDFKLPSNGPPTANLSHATSPVRTSSPEAPDGPDGKKTAQMNHSQSKVSSPPMVHRLLHPSPEHTPSQTPALEAVTGPSAPLASPPPSSPLPPVGTSLGPDVPAHYNVLLDIMEEFRREGVLSVRRAFLGEQLPKRQPKVYAQAGVEGVARPLKMYVDGAIDFGILVRESEENVSLAKNYTRQALKASTPRPSNLPNASSLPVSGRQGVPPQFLVLLDVMEELRDVDQTTYVSREYLGYILPQRQPNVYALAGVIGATKPSRAYIDMALALGIILREPNDNVSLPGTHIPARFTTLVLFMREQIAAGTTQVRRMTLGAELPKRQASIYAQAGLGASSKPLKKYVDAAIEAGVLVRITEEYVSLNASYR